VRTKNIPLPSTDSISGPDDSWHPSLAGRRPEAGSGRSWQGSALLVMPPRRRVLFRQVLNELGVPVHCAATCRGARALLQPPNSVGLVVTYVSLPDGNWCDVLRMLTDGGVPASVVVEAAEVNQTLWSEVFWRGAYDLLVQPCDWNDVCQCFEGALRSRPVTSLVSSRSAA
jgi:DNA-binding NtrC family response regulator